MQIGFNIWNKITEIKIKNDVYIFFFFASILIYIKKYFPEKMHFFINWLNENSISIKFVKRSENLMNNNMNYNFNPKSSDIIKLLNQINDNIKFSSELQNLILFSLCEYDIYGKYNKFIIILACAIINIYNSSKKIEFEKNSIKNDLLNSIKTFNIIDLKELENCTNEIINLLNREDDCDIDNEEYLNKCLTSSSSHNSINQIFSDFEDDINNEENNKIEVNEKSDTKNNNIIFKRERK